MSQNTSWLKKRTFLFWKVPGPDPLSIDKLLIESRFPVRDSVLSPLRIFAGRSFLFSPFSFSLSFYSLLPPLLFFFFKLKQIKLG